MNENELGQPIGFALPDFSAPPVPPREPMEGRYCRIEPLDTTRHAAQLHAANIRDTTNGIWTYLVYGPFASEQEYASWTDSVCDSTDPLFHAIVDLENQQAVGVASYLRIDPPNGTIEVGHINYSPLLQRTKAATEAMYLMMQRAFTLGYRRYEWKCDSLNAPSRSAAERLGFTFEGIFRQATHYKDRNRDTAWYAIIDSEWPAIDRAYQTWLDPHNFDDQGQQRQSLRELTSLALTQDK